MPTFGDVICPSNLVTVLNQNLSPDGERAYVAKQADGTVSVIDTVSLSALATVTIPDVGGPSGIAVTPDGSRAYVTTVGNYVWVIDTTKNAVVAKVPTGGATGVAITPDGKHIYVAGYNQFAVIATATNKVVATIPAASSARGSPLFRRRRACPFLLLVPRPRSVLAPARATMRLMPATGSP